MIEYYNGIQNIECNHIDKLLDLNQEEVNNLATGPQDLFFSKLESINFEMERKGLDKIDVTPKWNWKPGTYDKVKGYLYRRLWLHKKTNGLDKLLDRTRDRNNYLSYIQRQISEMERERLNLKYLGVSKDVDVEEWKDKTTDFCNNIISECDKVNLATDGKVTIETFIDKIENRSPNIYYDIKLSGLVMGIYSDSTLLQDIALNDIHIIYKTSLRHTLSDMRGGTASCIGKYLDSENNYNCMHPFISSSSRYNNNNYGTVCLDKYSDDFYSAINKNDLMSASFTLLQWGQYYNIKHANPYNQPHFLHLGAPDELSEEYLSTSDKTSILTHISTSIEKKIAKFNTSYYEHLSYIAKEFERIGCRWRDESALYNQSILLLDRFESEQWYMNESAIYEVIQSLKERFDNNETISTISKQYELITGDDFNYWRAETSKTLDNGDTEISYDWNELECMLQDGLIKYLINYNKDNEKMEPYLYKWFLSNGFVNEVIEVKVDENNKDTQMMEIMKQWAESSEGGR